MLVQFCTVDVHKALHFEIVVVLYDVRLRELFKVFQHFIKLPEISEIEMSI
jgi:hypothetical protein